MVHKPKINLSRSDLLASENAKLQARIEKLEAALEEMLKVAAPYYPDYGALRWQFNEIINIARQAVSDEVAKTHQQIREHEELK